MPFDGKDFVIDCSDGIGRQLYYFGTLDRHVFSFLDTYLRPGFNVVDVGANIGMYAYFAAKRVAPEGLVVGFEPNSGVFSRLQINADLPNVRLLKMAIGDRTGRVNLVVTEDSAKSFDDRNGASTKAVTVECRTLDPFIATDFGVDNVDYLKVDTEGFDYFVLLGAEALFRKQAVGLLQIECTANNVEIYDFLRDHGYRLCDLVPGHGMVPVESAAHLPFNGFAFRPDLADQWVNTND